MTAEPNKTDRQDTRTDERCMVGGSLRALHRGRGVAQTLDRIGIVLEIQSRGRRKIGRGILGLRVNERCRHHRHATPKAVPGLVVFGYH